MTKTLEFAYETPQEVKVGDDETTFTLVCKNEDLPVDLTTAKLITVKIGNRSGYLRGQLISIDSLAKLPIGQFNFSFDKDTLANFPTGNYFLEVWVTDAQGTSIYPSGNPLSFIVTTNIENSSGATITTITFDDFVAAMNKAASTIAKGDKGDKGDPGIYVPETFTNLAALQSKYPTGSNGIMVTADTGHKYIWANSTWTDAGAYQSVGIAENGLDLTKLSFDSSKLIGWDENVIDISPTEIQASATPITITFNAGCAWTLSGNMVSYLNSGTVEKTIPDGYVLYLDVTKVVNGNNLTTDSYIVAKLSDMPLKWSNILIACNFSGRLLSPVQALQNKLSRSYYGLKNLIVPENGLDLTKLSFDSSKLIGWDENSIDISPTGIQTNATPITITFNAGYTWTLSGNMVSYLNSENVAKTIPDGYVLYLDVTKVVNGNNLTTDSYIVAKLSDMPQRWNNILLALNFGERLFSPVQALQNKLSRNYYGLRDLAVPVTSILFYAPNHQYPIKIEDHAGTGATVTFNKYTVIW